MAFLSHLNQLLLTNTFFVTPVNCTPSLPPPITVVWIQSKPARKPRILADVPRRVVYVQVVKNNGNWGLEEDKPSAGVVVAEEEKPTVTEGFCGFQIDRGLKANSKTVAEIIELISQLEVKNPTPAPTDTLTLINEKWILA